MFHAAGVRVSAPVAQALCEQAEGWAVGLRLAVAPLKQGTDPGATGHLARPRRRQRRPVPVRGGAGRTSRPSVRRFLLRISVTDGAVARAGRAGCRGRPNSAPDPRRPGAREHLRGAVARRARRVPHPPALPGDAPGAARLHRALRARPPAPGGRRLVRRDRARDGGPAACDRRRGLDLSRRTSWSTRCWSAGCSPGRRSSRCRASAACPATCRDRRPPSSGRPPPSPSAAPPPRETSRWSPRPRSSRRTGPGSAPPRPWRTSLPT